MDVKVQDVEKNVVQLEIEVDADIFDEGMNKSFIKNAKNYSVPGFRKGKAPRSIIERYYGEHVLYEDAINSVCPEAYDKAVEEQDLHPVDRPEIDIVQIGEGKNLIFTAKVTVKPEVKLGDYKGVEVEKVESEVKDEDIDRELTLAQEKNSRLVAVEDRPVQDGDTVNIDFEGFIDGEPFEGGKAENFDLVIGSGKFIEGFEEQLVGIEEGKEVDVNVTFPEDYGNTELSGKPALFKVKVNSIKMKELPELDDEFAKDVSEFDTLEEYKADLKNKLTERVEQQAKRQMEDSVVEKVVKNATIELPSVMIDKQIENLMYDFNMRLQYQGMDLQKYFEVTGSDVNLFREELRERAENEVRTQLVIEEIMKAEGIEASEEQVNEEIRNLAESYKQSEEDFRKNLKAEDTDYIKGNISFKKTIDLLVENAKFI